MSSITLDVIKDRSTGKSQVILPEARVYRDQPRTDNHPRNTLGEIPREDTQGWNWANWGPGDCLPTEIREKLYKSEMAAGTIYKLIQMTYGNGLAYYHNDSLVAGETNLPRHHEPKIEAWLKRNRIGLKWLIPQLADYRFYMNAFSEFILSKNRELITGLYHKHAEFSRLSKQNESNLRIEWLYYSPYFGQMPPSNDRIKKITLLPWWDTESFMQQKTSTYKFAWHSRFETPGIKYYARPFWLGLFRKNGWLDASITVPEIVNAMMRNQVIITYQINIPESYFIIRHQDWNTYTDAERNKLIDELIKKLNDELSDTENLFKSVSTVFKQTEMGQDEGKVEIIAIDDKIKKDSWVPTSDVADAKVVQSLGLHPSQMGLAPQGGKMGAGSGSDQRESFNSGITLNNIDQAIILEPLNFVAQYNSQVDPAWDVTFFIDHTHHTTTNDQESGLKPSDTTIQID